ncbi:MAG: helix-turn-helix transcriptional regulator [Clostridium sp.]|nr:helix-turn-helix transcriptional regulator [Clostridium sp.]
MQNEKLKRELENEKIAEREIADTENYMSIEVIMKKIEEIRKERQKASPKYTQKYLADKAGVSLSTYANYLSCASDNIKLKTVINIANALQCRLSDLLDEEL